MNVKALVNANDTYHYLELGVEMPNSNTSDDMVRATTRIASDDRLGNFSGRTSYHKMISSMFVSFSTIPSLPYC